MQISALFVGINKLIITLISEHKGPRITKLLLKRTMLEGFHTPSQNKISPGDVMHSMVTGINSTVLYI